MMDVDGSCLVTVSCANYSQYVAIALRNLFDSRRGTDFELKWRSSSFRAHKVILELFLAQAIVDSSGYEQSELLLKQEVQDTNSEDTILCTLLEFMYKGEVAVPKEQLDALLDMARELDYQMLMDAITQSYCSRVISFEDGVPIKLEVANDCSENECATEGVSNFSESVHKAETLEENSRFLDVRFADHEKYVAFALRNLFDTKRGVDFSLNWGGKSIRAHRIILELFLTTEVVSCGVGGLPDPLGIKKEVPDVDCNSGNNVLESLLEFLYKGEVTVSENQMGDLLRASKELEFKMLEDALVQAFNSNVEEEEQILDVKEEDVKCSSEKINLKTCCVNVGEPISNQDNSPAMTDHPCNLEVPPSGATKLNKCPYCEYETLIASSYRRHLVSSHGINSKGKPVPKHKCPNCEFETFAICDYKRHLLTVHGITTKIEPAPKLKCPHCEFETFVICNYQRHLVSSHGINTKGEPAAKNKCPHCDFETFSWNFQRHLVRAHGINTKGEQTPKTKCPHCEYETFVICNYQRHLVSAHGINTNGNPAPKIECPHCEFETFSNLNFQRHLERTHGVNANGKRLPKSECPHCEFETFCAVDYRRHLVRIHGINSKGKPATKNECPRCEFETFSSDYYRRHMERTHGENAKGEPALKNKCPHCDYETHSSWNYRRHLIKYHLSRT